MKATSYANRLSLHERRLAPSSLTLALVGLATLVVYALSLDPDVGFWDTAELQVVPYILGLAHPTGNPTGILLGWTWAHVLFPFGEPSLRENLLSALCVAGGAVCGCAIALAYGVRPAIAGACAVAFALGATTWSHATHADVLDPAIFFCALTVLLVVLTLEAGRSLLWAAAVAAGLALGTHGAVVWYLPAALVLPFGAPRCPRPRVLVLCGAIVVVVAALLYAYLPIRSTIVTAARLDPTRALGLPPGQPFWDWGHPGSWAGFWGVVTGSSVAASGSLGAIAQVAAWPADAAFAFAQLRSFAPLPVLVCVLGLAAWGASRVRNGWALLLPLVLVTPFAASFTAESDVTRYFTFPVLCCWILVAIGLDRIASSWPAGRIVPTIAVLFVAGVAAYELAAGRGEFAVRGDHLGSTYIAEVLRATPNDDIVVAPWVYAMPLGYAAYARESMGARTVVMAGEPQIDGLARGWLRDRPVYAVTEQPPPGDVAARFVLAFHVNPDAAHDPKLYRLGVP